MPESSTVAIEAKSSLHPIHGEARGLTGSLAADVAGGRLEEAVGASGKVELPLDKLASGNALYDRELHRRIDIRRYPTATVELSAVKESGDGGSLQMTLELTFHGITRPFDAGATLSSPDDSTLVVEGDHTFDIRDFGVQPPRILTLKVHPEVAVHARIVAERSG
ncbi:MAG: YceI family protein [Acidimicrobiales bacterium]